MQELAIIPIIRYAILNYSGKLMEKLQELVPLVLFFAAYYFYDFFSATAALVSATSVFLIISYLRSPQKISHYTSQLLLITLGSITLLTKNEIFLVWKPTVMYLFTAASLLVSQVYYKKSLLQKGFSLVDLNPVDYPWQKVEIAISLLFTLLAVLNLQVFYTFGIDTWIKYKFYSIFAILALALPLILHVEHKSKHEQAKS